jgi:CubicO group peptidase (beta-lactamase class C family)
VVRENSYASGGVKLVVRVMPAARPFAETTSAILRLVQQDNLLLDQKVTDWLSKFPYPETTLRTLLNHRSGIQHYSKVPTLLKKKWDKKKIVTNEDVYNFIVVVSSI